MNRNDVIEFLEYMFKERTTGESVLVDGKKYKERNALGEAIDCIKRENQNIDNLVQAYERIDSLEEQLYELKDGRNFHHRENDNE